MLNVGLHCGYGFLGGFNILTYAFCFKKNLLNQVLDHVNNCLHFLGNRLNWPFLFGVDNGHISIFSFQ